jgi:protein-S-isoprenylcysteine O-methyltransferase Ste14
MLDNRLPPPVLAALIAFAMWWLAPGGDTPAWQSAAAWVVFAVAGGFGLPAVLAFRRAGTTVDPVHVDRSSALVTSGIYAVTRNPMYVSLTLLLVAWAVQLGGVLAWAGPLSLALWLDRFQIRPEERSMAARFGRAYDDYRARVRRWI